MGTEVLRPHDCFVHRFPLDQFVYQYRRRSYYENRNGFFNSKPAKITRPERLEKKNKWKKESSSSSSFQQQQQQQPSLLTIRKRSFSENELLLQNNNDTNYPPQKQQQQLPVETGRVTILRRGQSFDSFEKAKIIRNEMNGSDANIYAGSAFFSMSPPPNSLPLPSFFNNNNNKKFEYEEDSAASKDLRRLLGLK